MTGNLVPAPKDADPTEADFIERLDEECRRKLEELVRGIDHAQPDTVARFGVQIQREIAQLSSRVLDHIRRRDGGDADEALTELMVMIKEVDFASLVPKYPLLMKIPLVGKLFFGPAKKDPQRFRQAAVILDGIAARIDDVRIRLIKDNAVLDIVRTQNAEQCREIALYIAAGRLRLKEWQDESGSDLAVKLEERLYDLSLSRMIALQTGPQLQIIQSNNQLLMDKLQSSLLNTIPLWKNQMVIAHNIIRQKRTVQFQRQLDERTNIERLMEVQAGLIRELEETVGIQQEGRAKRKQAEAELAGRGSGSSGFAEG